MQKLKTQKRLPVIMAVSVSCLFSISLLIFRIWYADSLSLRFLFWNILLAAVPFVISTLMSVGNTRKMPLLVFLGLTSAWMLFFPNAPYILTDMLHLHKRADVPIWYDTLIMISFAWNGFILGLLSLLDMQHLISERFGKKTGWLFAFVTICLGSFGIYLGRFERWNSWDILTNPFGLTADIGHKVLHPTHNYGTIAVTLLFSVFIGISYFMIHAVRISHSHPAQQQK